MKALGQAQQLSIVIFLSRLVVWLIWLFLIALDGVMASSTIERGMFWLPWVGVGLFMAWCLDGFVRDDQQGRAMFLMIPYLVLADFVQG